MLAPDLAGLTIPIAPNSSAAVVTHYAGEGVAPQAQIDALDSISPLTWAYVDEGSEGINYYPGFSAFAGAFNLVKWQDPNNGPLGN